MARRRRSPSSTACGRGASRRAATPASRSHWFGRVRDTTPVLSDATSSPPQEPWINQKPHYIKQPQPGEDGWPQGLTCLHVFYDGAAQRGALPKPIAYAHQAPLSLAGSLWRISSDDDQAPQHAAFAATAASRLSTQRSLPPPPAALLTHFRPPAAERVCGGQHRRGASQHGLPR